MYDNLKKLKDKSYNAQITIFAAMSILLVISLVVTCIRSVSAAAVKSELDRISSLSCESVFAGYNREVLDEFDILLLKKSDMLDDDLRSYVVRNSKGIAGNARLTNVYFANMSVMTDDNGSNLFKEVIDYMDYAIYSQFLENAGEAKNNMEKSEAVNEITDKVAECQSKVFEQDKYLLRLASLTEGIKTNETGFVSRHSAPIMTGETYVKQIITEEFSKISAAIDDDRVYNAVKNGDMYTDIGGLISDIVDIINEFEEIVDSEGETEAIAECQPEYLRMYNILRHRADSVLEVSYSALDCITDYETQSGNNYSGINECEELLNSKRNIIGEELFADFSNDIKTMKEPEDSIGKLCNTEAFKEQITQNVSILKNIIDIISDTEETISEDNYNSIYNNISECAQVFSDYRIDKLRFDYSSVEFTDNGRGITAFTELYDMLSKTIAQIVLDGMDISDKDIQNISSQSQLAHEYVSKAGIKGSRQQRWADGLIENVRNQALYNEYVMDKFNSFTDYVSDDGKVNTDTGKKLDYMTEFIITGKKSDMANLNSVITKLSLIRQGADMTYLITNPEKKNEAFAMALSLVGFSGNAAIIKAAQYTIMAVWAYAEALLDVRKLCRGQKLELVKTDDTWEISLGNLLEMNWLNNDISDNASSQKGLGYKDYLRILLLTESQSSKLIRTMSAMEIRMEELGCQGFRMKDYICSAECNIEFVINSINQTYIRNFEYGYS